MELVVNIIFWMIGTFVFLVMVAFAFLRVVEPSANKKMQHNKISGNAAPDVCTDLEPISDLPYTYVSDALVRRKRPTNRYPDFDPTMHRSINKFF